MIALNAIDLRGTRRMRLVFSRSLAVGAYDPSLYAVGTVDGKGASPRVKAALAVTGCPFVVELALSADLVQGGLYGVSAVGVPGDDSSVTGATSALEFRVPGTTRAPVQRTPTDDPMVQVFGRDLLHDGQDLAETANGDLATVGGTENFEGAMLRRALSNGLPWAPEYGAKPRKFVDGPGTSVMTLRGVLQAQAVKDDRTKSASATFAQDGSDTLIQLTITPVIGAPVTVRPPLKVGG